jgi:hypothetical protein
VRRGFGRRFEAAEKSLWTQGNSPAVSTLAAWLSSVQGDPAEVLKRTLDAFFADPYCSTQHFPIAHLARYPQKYFEPRQTPGPGLRRTSKQARAEAQAAVIARDDAAVKRLVAEAKDLEDAEERAARGYRARA